MLAKSRQLTGFNHLQHVKDVINDALLVDKALLNAELSDELLLENDSSGSRESEYEIPQESHPWFSRLLKIGRSLKR